MAKASGTIQEPMTERDWEYARELLDWSAYIGEHGYIPFDHWVDEREGLAA